MSDVAVVIIVLLVGAIAALYAGVGHGGASGYLAVMALFGVSAAQMRPSALVLNIVVSALATIAFAKAGHFRWRLLWPFIVTSIPLAYLGGTLTIGDTAFRVLVAATLVLAAGRLFMPKFAVKTRRLPLSEALACGAAIGLLSGLVGVGGGIFLTPLLILCAWATPLEAAAVSAPFILVNSLAGLGGLLRGGAEFPSWLWWACGAAVIGGWLGARWSSREASQAGLRTALGVVLLIAAVKFVIL